LSADEMRTDFVCIPRPITRSEKPDGGPIRYRVSHQAKLWGKGEKPVLTQRILEGNADLCI
jgi:alkaline phosphatase D